MINTENKIVRFLNNYIGNFNHKKYFRRRAVVTDPGMHVPMLLKLYYLLWIKRKDSYHGCSFGTNIHIGNHYATPPYLPHGPKGIIIGYDAVLGSGVIVYHQVTVAAGGVIIGDHVELGNKCTVLPGVKVGNYARVGANCVVSHDVPDYATIVPAKARIIERSPEDVQQEK